MAVETDGKVQMRGDSGPGVSVRVFAGDDMLRIVSGEEVVGEWHLDEIGIHALQEGFAIRAEGEEFVLKVKDEAGVAEEMGLAASSPRLARKVAAAHNPEERELAEPPQGPQRDSTDLVAITYAVAGILVVLGGVILRIAPDAQAIAQPGGDSVDFWLAFVIGGTLMIAVALVISMGSRWGRALALFTLAAVIVLFGFVVSGSSTDGSYVTAYGFVAGGVVVGVAVLFSGSLRDTD